MGNMELAKTLIEVAKENGADLAKFQLYDSKKLYGEYQPTELTREQAEKLFLFGQKIGIEVFFSVFDLERVGWCEEMGVKRYKIACSQCRNMYLINTVLLTGKPVLISRSDTPGGLLASGQVSFLYCVPKYPASHSDLHFDKVNFYFFRGFSDHTIGLDATKVAIAMGAIIIEKHFAVNHNIGVDAPWSMTHSELKELRQFYDTFQEATD